VRFAVKERGGIMGHLGRRVLLALLVLLVAGFAVKAVSSFLEIRHDFGQHKDAVAAFVGLTPKVLQRRCGKPDDDRLTESSVGHYARAMDYRGVSLVFTDSGGWFRLNHPDEYDGWIFVESDISLRQVGPDEAAHELPCLTLAVH
jgi:hypothetical protein